MREFKVCFFIMAGNSNTQNKVRYEILDSNHFFKYFIIYRKIQHLAKLSCYRNTTIEIFCIYKIVTFYRYNFFGISFS